MSKRKSSNGASFLIQGSILAMASIICRIIGMLYRIPITAIIGDTGNGFYSAAFEIYNVALIISSFSIPTAVSKMVSSYRAKNERKMIYQILKGSLLFAIISGGLASVIVYFGSDFFATNLLKKPYAAPSIRVLAFVLIVVAILGVIRGFFQGMGSMIPSAFSQIIEQIVNAIVSIYAAYVLYNEGLKIGQIIGNPEVYAAGQGAKGSTLGTAFGAIAALLFLVFLLYVYLAAFKKKMALEKHTKVESFGFIMKTILITMLPILFSTAIYNISDFIDDIMYAQIRSHQGFDEIATTKLWGIYMGKYRMLINVPIALSASLAASSVPALTVAYKSRDLDHVKKLIQSGMRMVMIFAFPCFVGLSILGRQIFILFKWYDGIDEASMMMYVGTIAVIFYSISTLSNGILQGIDRMKIPVRNAGISLIIHVLLLFLLLWFTPMDIYAVIFTNAFFSFLICILNGICIYQAIGFRQEVNKTFLIPFVCSAIMGVVTYGSYQLLQLLLTSSSMSEYVMNLLGTLVSVLLSVIVYSACILLFGGITEEELIKFPKGTTLVAITKKFHLLRS